MAPRPSGRESNDGATLVARLAASTVQALLDTLSNMGNEGLEAVLVLRANGQEAPMVLSLAEDLHATSDNTRVLLEAAYAHVLEVKPSEERTVGG